MDGVDPSAYAEELYVYGTVGSSASVAAATATDQAPWAAAAAPTAACDPANPPPPFTSVMTIVMGEADAQDVATEFYLGLDLASRGLVLPVNATVAGLRLPNLVELVAGSTLGIRDEVGIPISQVSV
ncbi:hypothetical protein HK405_013712 [Cladochytrium tenue]|nr:hypothetical protein HK405_013712 [Cladochytrium tenue]